MDNKMSPTEAESREAGVDARPLAKGTSLFVPAADAATGPDSGERNGVFRQLVSDDADIAGLVAYSIYKQNKLDWLKAFEQAKGRTPTADELAAYIIGEGTPRRLATYRHLAEATLAGNGPEVGGVPGPRPLPRRAAGSETKGALSPAMLGLYALVAILFVAGFVLATHYTASSR
jgi:hypothetical protein